MGVSALTPSAPCGSPLAGCPPVDVEVADLRTLQCRNLVFNDWGPRVPLPQGLMFQCSAGCCEDSRASMQQVHQCIERCHMPLAQAQALVTSELEKFQDRLARCTMHCNDKAKDSIDAGTKESQVKQQLDSCVTKCVDDHLHLIPTMTKKMKEALSNMGK